MARTSSLHCLSCTNPYQTPHSLNCLPLFTERKLFFTEKCFVASPSQKSAPITYTLTNVGPPPRRRVKQVQCGKLALQPGNGAHVGHFEGFVGISAIATRKPVYATNSNRTTLFGGIKTSRRNMPCYVQTPQTSLLIFARKTTQNTKDFYL